MTCPLQARHSGAAKQNPESRVVRLKVIIDAAALHNTSTFMRPYHCPSSGFRVRLRRPGMTAGWVVAQKQDAK